MDKICREISNNFLKELNTKYEYKEVKDFFKYAKSLYEDFVVVDRYYKERFNSISPMSIKKFIDIFNLAFDKIIETIFDVYFNEQVLNDDYMLKFGRFDFDDLVKRYNSSHKLLNGFKYKTFNKETFDNIKTVANIIFKLENECAKYTKTFWDKHDYLNIEDGIFVKIITKDNWRNNKLNMSLKKYYNSRIGISVSYVNNLKSKFFKENQLDILAGIIYEPKDIICGNYCDSYTSEFINNINPIDNINFSLSKINRVYSEKSKGKIHDIYAYGTLTSTPHSVLTCDDCYNEVVINKNTSKPIAVFYVNEQSKNYALDLSKKHNLPIIEISSINKLNIDNIVITK